MARCESCKANKVCDHNKYGFENCGNYIPPDDVVEVRREEWVPVTERMPAESGKYIVCTNKGGVYQAKYYTYPTGGHWGQRDKGRNITHWRPLPDPPSGEDTEAGK